MRYLLLLAMLFLGVAYSVGSARPNCRLMEQSLLLLWGLMVFRTSIQSLVQIRRYN